jgi:predicted CopG family antitoxin
MTNTTEKLNKVLPHQLFKEVREDLMDFIENAEAGEVAFLFGAHKVGKKTVLESALCKTQDAYADYREKNSQLMPVLAYELETSLDDKTYIVDVIEGLTEKLLPQFDIPEVDRAVLAYEKVATRLKPSGKREQLTHLLKERCTRVIALYEAHVLSKKPALLQLVLDTFRSIAKKTGSVLIIVGDYHARELSEASNGFLLSTTPIHFPVYNPNIHDEHITGWSNIMGALISILPSKDGRDLTKMDAEVLSKSLGSYGLLVEWMKRAVRTKLRSKKHDLAFSECLVKTMKSEYQLIGVQDDIYGYESEEEIKKLKKELREKQGAVKEVKSSKGNRRPGKNTSGKRIVVEGD